VSPGKSLEGVAGGCVAAVIWTLLWMFFADLGKTSPVFFFLLAQITTLFSVAGDLFESLFKRIAHIKDSGHLLPGHGGVLDRIDSLTAGAPVFVVGLMLL
jgi:phosphatidate cytidylyltransferase